VVFATDEGCCVAGTIDRRILKAKPGDRARQEVAVRLP
jgi:hypothetical protein